MTQKLFMELDDDLFFNEVIKLSNKEKKLSLFDKLKSEFLIINNINNYEAVQKKLYAGKNRREIIEFEVARIINNLGDNDFVTSKLINIEKLLKMYNDELPQNVYDIISNQIIEIELILDMKIGLFVELCKLFKLVSRRKMDEEEIFYKQR